MNNLKYKYFIFEGINGSEYILIDRKRRAIYTLKNGKYYNETKKCEKIYLKDKDKSWDKRRIGGDWIKCLITGESNGISSNSILKTNKLKEFDLKCMEIQQEQIEKMLKNIKYYRERLLKDEQYYTYAYSNLDYLIGEDSISKDYFKSELDKENIIEQILKPKPYEEKEQECTILDEEYYLGTTFYYIDEPKNNYEKFMKYLSENIIVKDIWKDNTILVGISEFLNNHVKEITETFGKQRVEVHIENLIKMIDGNATESCYKDFIKNFKIDFNFMMCNNHTFNEIKETSIEELDYEKAHDLATVENRDAHVSVYLGVYDNEFELTYSVHSKEDFDGNFENTIAEQISIKDIKSEKELKELMESKLENFYNSKLEVIEELSQRLDEDRTVEQEESEEMEE